MAERRTRNFMLALTPSEREALQRLSEQQGSSGADVIRRLVLAEARRLKVVSSKAPATPQREQTRAGAPADGSIDDHLDDLAAALAAATSTLTVVSASTAM